MGDEHICRGEKWGKGHRMKLEAQTGIRTYKTLNTILKILKFMPRSMDSHNISIDNDINRFALFKRRLLQ